MTPGLWDNSDIKMIKSMTPDNWQMLERIGHFNRFDPGFSAPENVAFETMVTFESHRQRTGMPFIMHVTVAQGGHAPASLHYVTKDHPCLAGDGHTPGMSLYKEVGLMIDAGFTGVGAYPFWNTRGVHGDRRDLIGKPTVFWIQNEAGEYIYYHDRAAFLTALTKYSRAMEIY